MGHYKTVASGDDSGMVNTGEWVPDPGDAPDITSLGPEEYARRVNPDAYKEDVPPPPAALTADQEIEGLAAKMESSQQGAIDVKEREGQAVVDQASNVYFPGMVKSEEDFRTKISNLERQADENARSAKKTYENIQPKFQNQMEDAVVQSKSAMSLKDAMDPDNAIQKAWRAKYEQQAQGEGRQGLADVGVMQSLGAQAVANQMGSSGMPMSGAQMQAMQAQYGNQAGQAFANTQRRIQNLRDQGLVTGMQRSDLAYNQGIAAKDRVLQVGNNMMGLEKDYTGISQALRNEGAGYAKEGLGSTQRGLGYGMAPTMMGAQFRSGIAAERAGATTGADLIRLAQAQSGDKAALAERLARIQAEAVEKGGMMGMYGQMGGGLMQGLGSAIPGLFKGAGTTAAGEQTAGGFMGTMEGMAALEPAAYSAAGTGAVAAMGTGGAAMAGGAATAAPVIAEAAPYAVAVA